MEKLHTLQAAMHYFDSVKSGNTRVIIIVDNVDQEFETPLE